MNCYELSRAHKSRLCYAALAATVKEIYDTLVSLAFTFRRSACIEQIDPFLESASVGKAGFRIIYPDSNVSIL